MIKSNLRNILRDKNISATSLATISKVSRTAINQLVNNTSSGIQFDTINKICCTLGIKVEDLLLYSPFDVTTVVKSIDINDDKVLVDAVLKIDEPMEVANEKYTYNMYTSKEIPLLIEHHENNLFSVKFHNNHDFLNYQKLLSDVSQKTAMYIRNVISEVLTDAVKDKLKDNDAMVLATEDFIPILDNKNINAKDIHRLLLLFDR